LCNKLWTKNLIFNTSIFECSKEVKKFIFFRFFQLACFMCICFIAKKDACNLALLWWFDLILSYWFVPVFHSLFPHVPFSKLICCIHIFLMTFIMNFNLFIYLLLLHFVNVFFIDSLNSAWSTFWGVSFLVGCFCAWKQVQ
jgi:hypothetical protein